MKQLYTYENHKTKEKTDIIADNITDADLQYELKHPNITLTKSPFIGVSIQPIANKV